MVDRVGWWGGLAHFWSQGVDVSMLSFSSGHTDIRIRDQKLGWIVFYWLLW